MKGRKPAPAAVKLFRGEKDKRRINRDEPEIRAGRPPRPDDLPAVARKCWDRTCDELAALKILAVSDLAIVEAYCRAYARYRAIERTMRRGGRNGGYTPANVRLCNQVEAQVVRFASELGLTPTARARLTVGDANAPKGKLAKYVD